MMSSFMNNLHVLLLCIYFTLVDSTAAEQRSYCSPNDCLRALRVTARSADSHSFCSRYISPVVPTVTVTTTLARTILAPTITVVSSRISAETRTTVATETAVSITTIQGEPVITTQTATIVKRAVQIVPKYLTACSPFSSLLSSACSCFIGPITAPVTVTATTYKTVKSLSTSTVLSFVTILTTKVVKSTSTLTQISTTTQATVSTATQTVLRCNPSSTNLSQACVYLRIEGPESTIFEDFIVSGPRTITTPSGGTHICDGTNANANPQPGGTATTALDQAAQDLGFSYDGIYNSQFEDYFIQSIAGVSQTTTQFWGLLNNYQFTSTGGCQFQAQRGDVVLWAFDAFNAVAFLHASSFPTINYPDTSSYPVTVIAGNPHTIYVLDGSTNSPVSGAIISDQVSDTSGKLILTLTVPGIYSFKAEKSGSIRSNYVTLVVISP